MEEKQYISDLLIRSKILEYFGEIDNLISQIIVLDPYMEDHAEEFYHNYISIKVIIDNLFEFLTETENREIANSLQSFFDLQFFFESIRDRVWLLHSKDDDFSCSFKNFVIDYESTKAEDCLVILQTLSSFAFDSYIKKFEALPLLDAIELRNLQLHNFRQKEILLGIPDGSRANINVTLLKYLDNEIEFRKRNQQDQLKAQDKSNLILQLPTNLKTAKLAILFELLVKHGFIPGETDIDCFNWAFGSPDQIQPELWKPITWIKNKQLLRELLYPYKNTKFKLAEIERVVPKVFVDLKGKPFKLAGNKPEGSIDSDLIIEIVKKIATI